MKENMLLISESEKDYELIDSGEGEKLERYGKIILSRPDPQAIWSKGLSRDMWEKVHASYGGEGKGKWNAVNEVPDFWPIEFGGLTFNIRLSSFKHTGIFPEHKPTWEWIENTIQGKEARVLNLFGYTGGATLAAARAGADVVHLDGSKVAINWAKENARSSDLGDRSVRWMLDDALSFVKREARREGKYDGIIMDPPAYGHGPKGEVWQIEDDLLALLRQCREIMSDKPLFIILNGYAAGYSPVGYANILGEIFPEMKDGMEQGELGIKESSRGIILPAGIFARWRRS
jgi:23S rRNA (cytosine1962-C5)-methyltransferase